MALLLSLSAAASVAAAVQGRPVAWQSEAPETLVSYGDVGGAYGSAVLGVYGGVLGVYGGVLGAYGDADVAGVYGADDVYYSGSEQDTMLYEAPGMHNDGESLNEPDEVPVPWTGDDGDGSATPSNVEELIINSQQPTNPAAASGSGPVPTPLSTPSSIGQDAGPIVTPTPGDMGTPSMDKSMGETAAQSTAGTSADRSLPTPVSGEDNSSGVPPVATVGGTACAIALAAIAAMML